MPELKNCPPEIKERKNAYTRRMRRALASRELKPPVVVGLLLREPFLPNFSDFLLLPETRAQFGMDNDAAEMLAKLVQERDFLLLRASNHHDNRAKARRLLGDFVRRTYVGDERGVTYWRRVSKVIWIAYENHLRLQRWAARVERLEDQRIARWKARGEKEQKRLRDQRARQKVSCITFRTDHQVAS